MELRSRRESWRFKSGSGVGHGTAYQDGHEKRNWPVRPTDIEKFVDAPGRKELVAEVRKKIDELGIEYLYLQFVSVTGRIMGKGIPADHWEIDRQEGLPARLRRHHESLPQPARRLSRLWAGGGRAGRHPRARDLHAAPVGQAGGAAVVHAVPQPRGARRSRRLPDRRLRAAISAASTTSSRRTTGCSSATAPSRR